MAVCFVPGAAAGKARRAGKLLVCRSSVATNNETLLLSMVAGTGQGQLLDERRRVSVENIVSLMERENANEINFPRNLDMLDGKWRLVYTTQVVPPVTFLGAVSGIYQQFDTSERRIKNVVKFSLLPMVSADCATATLTIASKFETLDQSRLLLSITDLSLQLGNMEPRMLVAMPGDMSMQNLLTNGSEEVEITYLGESGVRVLRSARGELRVFVREH